MANWAHINPAHHKTAASRLQTVYVREAYIYKRKRRHASLTRSSLVFSRKLLSAAYIHYTLYIARFCLEFAFHISHGHHVCLRFLYTQGRFKGRCERDVAGSCSRMYRVYTPAREIPSQKKKKKFDASHRETTTSKPAIRLVDRIYEFSSFAHFSCTFSLYDILSENSYGTIVYICKRCLSCIAWKFSLGILHSISQWISRD